MTSTMRIRLILEVDNPDDEDEGSDTGLTETAYNRLTDALAHVGFSIVDGPDRHEER
jgi:hypothetical protein